MNKAIINDIFNPVRFLRLVYLDIRRELKTLLVTLGGVLAFFLLISLFHGYQRETEPLFYNYIAIFVVGGLIFTSRSFKEYYRRNRNTPQLMLPASKTEKWLEKLVITTVGWIVSSFVIFSVYAFLSAGLNELIFGFHTSPLWWRSELGWLFLHYAVIQSIFFLGASIFRKTAVFKTLLSIFVLSILISVISALFFRIIFGDVFSVVLDISSNDINFGPEDAPAEIFGYFERLWTLLKVFYWAVIIPFCWGVSLVRFREIEVKDGI